MWAEGRGNECSSFGQCKIKSLLSHHLPHPYTSYCMPLIFLTPQQCCMTFCLLTLLSFYLFFWICQLHSSILMQLCCTHSSSQTHRHILSIAIMQKLHFIYIRSSLTLVNYGTTLVRIDFPSLRLRWFQEGSVKVPLNRFSSRFEFAFRLFIYLPLKKHILAVSFFLYILLYPWDLSYDVKKERNKNPMGLNWDDRLKVFNEER